LWTKSTDANCLCLRLERQFSGAERMGLGHGELGTVEAIADERPKKRVADGAMDGKVVFF
jgi:hypothetical protein